MYFFRPFSQDASTVTDRVLLRKLEHVQENDFFLEDVEREQQSIAPAGPRQISSFSGIEIMCALLRVLTKYFSNCYKIQTHLINFKSNPSLKNKNMLSPASFPTITGFVYNLLKRYSLDNFNLRSLKNDGVKSWSFSEGEREFASYMQLLNPNIPLESVFTSASGAPKLANGKRSDGRIGACEIEYCGSIWHGAKNVTFPKFPINLKDFDFTYHWKFISAEWDHRANSILQDNPHIQHLVAVWDLQWTLLKKNNKLLQEMVRNDLLMVATPMNPRNSLIGCRSELYKPFWRQEEDPSREFFALDFNAQFSSLITQQLFSAGNAKRYCYNELKNRIAFDFSQKKFLFDNKQICSGYVKALILPIKQGENMPALFCRLDGRTGAFLCKRCFIDRNEKPCTCGDVDRMFNITCTFVDLELAFLSNSYQVLKFHEAILYDQQLPLGQTFFQCIHREVIKAKGFPEHVSAKEQNTYVSSCNDILGLKNENALRASDLEVDPTYKKLLKTISTAALGRLGAKTGVSSKLCSTSQQLEEIFATQNVSQFQEIGSRCLISYETKTPRYTRGNYSIFLAEIFAWSRRHLYESAKKVCDAGGDLVSLTVDAIQFVNKKGRGPILEIGNAPGQWKHIYKQKVIGYHALNEVSCVTNFHEAEPVTKVAGLQLSQVLCKSNLANEHIKLVKNALLQKRCNSIKTWQTKKHKKGLKKVKKRSEMNLQGKLSHKRYFKIDKNQCVSFPYGYNST